MKNTIYWSILILLVIISCSKSSKTQTKQNSDTSQQMEQPVVLDVERDKAWKDSIFLLEKENLLKYGTQQEYSDHLDSTDDLYLKWQDKFEAMTIAESLPESFPPYSDGMSQDTYMEIVQGWFKENPELLKPEFR